MWRLTTHLADAEVDFVSVFASSPKRAKEAYRNLEKQRTPADPSTAQPTRRTSPGQAKRFADDFADRARNKTDADLATRALPPSARFLL